MGSGGRLDADSLYSVANIQEPIEAVVGVEPFAVKVAKRKGGAG